MKKTLTIVVLGLIVVGSWFLFFHEDDKPIDEKQAVPAVSKIVQDKTQEVVLVIDNGQGKSESFEMEFFQGMTAFDLLNQQMNEEGINLKTKTFDIGIMIEAIGDVKNGDNEKYWLYYVNNEMAPVAADKNNIKPGDIVEFKFEESPF